MTALAENRCPRLRRMEARSGGGDLPACAGDRRPRLRRICVYGGRMLVFERMLVFAEVDARVYGARSPAFGCGAEPTPGGSGA